MVKSSSLARAPPRSSPCQFLQSRVTDLNLVSDIPRPSLTLTSLTLGNYPIFSSEKWDNHWRQLGGMYAAAAAAKSLQSCPTLCNPIDGSPPGSPIPGILQSELPFPSPMHENESEVSQSCLTPSDPMDCSLPGSSVHGIFQARVLEWVAIAFSEECMG